MSEMIASTFDKLPVVCLASAGWETDTPVNVHHIMRRLSVRHPILWVDSQPLRVPSTSRADLRKVVRRLGTMAGGVRSVKDNVWCITPSSLPFYRNRGIQNWNDRRLRKQLLRTTASLGFSHFVLWVFLPTAAGLAGTLDEVLTIYHCVDDYASNPGVDAQAIRALELQLLEKADVVFATSVTLQRKLADHHPHVVLMPAGVDPMFFASGLAEPEDLALIPKPRIGFIGAVSSYKVDIDLLVESATAYPKVSFVLVGPVGAGDPGTKIAGLRKLPNVFLLGARKHPRLPEYLYGMDVLMLPSAGTLTMASSFPVKLFEYFATGKPVVAIGQEPLLAYESLMIVADSHRGFLDAIGAALEETNQSKSQERLAVARQNTWDCRMEQICAAIDEALVRKSRGQP